MLVIRLQRTGRENDPTYRVVVAEKARPVKGKFLEILGHHLPSRKDVFHCDQERVMHWVKNGAIPSDTVARLLRKAGMKDMEKFMERYTKQKKKGEKPAEAAPVVPKTAAESTPVEAPKAESEEPKPAQ